MTTIRVQPRPTPAERSNKQIDVEVDEALSLAWTLEIREGHDRLPRLDPVLERRHDSAAAPTTSSPS